MSESRRTNQRKRRRPSKADDGWAEHSSYPSTSETTSKKSKKPQHGTKKTPASSPSPAAHKKAKASPAKSAKKSNAVKKAKNKTAKKVPTKVKGKAKVKGSKSFPKKKSNAKAKSNVDISHAALAQRRKEPLVLEDTSELILRVPTSNPRPSTELKTPAICLPIVYGSIAWWLGRDKGAQNSHKWTMYVRGVDGEDISHIIKSVEFNLHPSFPQPQREVHKHPFEITTFGWGEFEVRIRLHFNDPDEPPLDCYHNLRLYPPGGQAPSLKRPVVSESYDEIVFNRPNENFAKALMRPVARRLGASHPMRDVFAHFDEERDLKTVVDALEFVEKETRSIRSRIGELESFFGGS